MSARSYGKSMSSLLEISKVSSYVAIPLGISTSNEWEFLLFHILTSICAVSMLDLSHTSKCTTVLHCYIC